MVKLKIEEDGDFWKLSIKDSRTRGEPIVSKVIPNQVRPEIETRVNLYVVEKEDGTKGIDTSISEVYYPKARYELQAVERAAAELAKKNVEADCPLCQKMKAALSVDSTLPLFDTTDSLTLEDVLPDLGDMISPVQEVMSGLNDMFKMLLASPFETLQPAVKKS